MSSGSRNIATLVKEYRRNIVLSLIGIAITSIQIPIAKNGIFYFGVVKAGCEQSIATNKLIRERDYGNRGIVFLYQDGGHIRRLLPDEFIGGIEPFLFCRYIADAKRVKEHEEKYREYGVPIDNPYK